MFKNYRTVSEIRSMQKKNEKQSNQSSIRLLQIMECMAASRIPMRLQEIAQQTGLTQSTVLRYIYALIHENYVYHDSESSRYGLTWRVCRLAENVSSMLGLRNVTTSFVTRLANALSLGSCLVVEHDLECMYLDCIDNPNSPTLQRIGKRAALHSTGSGKVLLSHMTESQLANYIAVKGLTPFTEHTITDPLVLAEELAKIRKQGYAMDEEECELGLRCISVPLKDYSGRAVAAMSVFGAPEDLPNERLQKEVLPALRTAAKTISARLGYQEEPPFAL